MCGVTSVIEPYYPKGENEWPPVGLSIMLRVYFLQQWFNLSDPGAEEALYESPAQRRFAGVDLGRISHRVFGFHNAQYFSATIYHCCAKLLLPSNC